MFKTISQKYQLLIDHFVPQYMKADRDAWNQARMFLISHTMGPIIGNSVPLAFYIFDPTPNFDLLLLTISITAFWIFPFLLRAGVRYDVLVITSVINLNFCIFWSCYWNGGVSSPTLPWVLTIPIISFFYIGGEKKLQPHLMSIFAVSFASFLAAYLWFQPALNDIPDTPLTALGIISTIAALAYAAMMAIYYSRIFDAGVELELEVKRRGKATEELRHAVATADRAGMMKAEFLARMSHELRTPLNAVIGYSELLKEEAMDSDDPQMGADVDRIHDAGQYLLRLINMILDLSKIEAGRMQFEYKTIALAEVIDRAVEAARGAVSAHSNRLSVNIAPNVTDIETDDGRLLQIIDSILQNAAEHTENGEVEIWCELLEKPEAAPRYAICIRDTGTGIAPERLATLFETLIDSREASTSKYGGTGLNLTVTKKLCEAMGGDILVESSVGVGSCFAIVLPQRVVRDTQAPADRHEEITAAAA